jgi:hypothetical protein
MTYRKLVEGSVINRVLRGLFTNPERPTYFEIKVTDDASFVLRMLTPEASAWAERFLAEPLPNGDRLVSGFIVAAIAADAIERSYRVRFV